MNPVFQLSLATILGAAGLCIFAGWLLGVFTPEWLEERAQRRALRSREPRVPEPDEIDRQWQAAVRERDRVVAEQSGARQRLDVERIALPESLGRRAPRGRR